MDQHSRRQTLEAGKDAVKIYLELVKKLVSEQLRPDLQPPILQLLDDGYKTLYNVQSPRQAWTLRLSHICKFNHCGNDRCNLCKHNPNRPCDSALHERGVVGENLTTECYIAPFLELYDENGELVQGDVKLNLEAFIIDDGVYTQALANLPVDPVQRESVLESTLPTCRIYHRRSKQNATVQQPLLEGRTVFEYTVNTVPAQVLPQLKVMDNSDKLSTDKRFRLVVRVAGANSIVFNDQPILIRAAVSNSFEVVTARSRGQAKAPVPNLTDPIGTLCNIGKKTRAKLQTIDKSAVEAGLQLPSSAPKKVTQVREFLELLTSVADDKSLYEKLRTLLLMSEVKLNQTRVHAECAVRPDNRLRLWLPSDHNSFATLFQTCMGQVWQPKEGMYGIVFRSSMGQVDLTVPVALLQRLGPSQDIMLGINNLMPNQQCLMQQLQQQAVQNWFLSGHPGWSVMSYDSPTYERRGKLEVCRDWQNDTIAIGATTAPTQVGTSLAMTPDQVHPPSPPTAMDSPNLEVAPLGGSDSGPHNGLFNLPNLQNPAPLHLSATPRLNPPHLGLQPPRNTLNHVLHDPSRPSNQNNHANANLNQPGPSWSYKGDSLAQIFGGNTGIPAEYDSWFPNLSSITSVGYKVVTVPVTAAVDDGAVVTVPTVSGSSGAGNGNSFPIGPPAPKRRRPAGEEAYEGGLAQLSPLVVSEAFTAGSGAVPPLHLPAGHHDPTAQQFIGSSDIAEKLFFDYVVQQNWTGATQTSATMQPAPLPMHHQQAPQMHPQQMQRPQMQPTQMQHHPMHPPQQRLDLARGHGPEPMHDAFGNMGSRMPIDPRLITASQLGMEGLEEQFMPQVSSLDTLHALFNSLPNDQS